MRMYAKWIHMPVADPGFPRGGAPALQGAPTYDFAKFSQKLHDIETIWTGGATYPSHPNLDAPLNATPKVLISKRKWAALFALGRGVHGIRFLSLASSVTLYRLSYAGSTTAKVLYLIEELKI